MPTVAAENVNSNEVRRACSRLFLLESVETDRFLENLDLEMVKKAYRERAKTCHPDVRHSMTTGSNVENFLKIQKSYEVLTSYLERRAQESLETVVRGRKIIAVGGAKGGIGKSIFAANLSVILASKGFKTVAVDLDLGGANLHLYLGKRAILKQSINDFLRKRVDTLQELAVDSGHGPLLIGGDSSELGAANIEFSRKLRLLRAVKNIEADYIVLDLGGDTSYNIVDFFNLADYAVVLTTLDTVSYISSYHFMKAAMYRKLNRLFGPESKFRDEREADLERLVREVTMAPDGPKVKSIEDLIEWVREKQPMNLSILVRALRDFNPCLVVNKVEKEIDIGPVVTKVQEVSKKWLSREVRYLGSISAQREITESVKALIPTVSQYPRGRLVAELEMIYQNLVRRV
ncbi:MAG: Flagellum site-determining protein YlxH [Syntrophorhabdus sp. PtaU1.Bin153]|nr:MAG: Flagellum site-determining protein YlxH [Syntrophorhabdus sp. PtaU1.Bin153]